MGLLDQLWDDTVAGPRPDHGLGRLRKYASFSPSSAAAGTTAAAVPSADVAAPAVTRSITILRPPALSVTSPRSESGSGSAPSSPASVPDSPFGTATTPRGESGWSKLRRKGRMAADGIEASPGTPRSPTVYDWVVISSLDR
ncbi:dormancy-associated protein homolog 3-like [Triticum urartu]|uniref:Auxin-repressed 12.5 kDa protein n=1 Tax=Triticum urartu TaxID=4572 RepID=A0A8R7QHW8_TRIUA|nr:dormancy-associated protein homolog 3-like [Triticum dicoccoides]XP_044381390.1 dormancy-associated protein homolog 3-like [Triticum aestivum]XP_048530285.1 dormancy-associated protein homolog 3-like [Triticum urartu]XP_048530286.1 dormancy-associated protein homolog 3-like [Triticum urartu]